MFEIRTDLAVETWSGKGKKEEPSGIRVEKKQEGDDIVITRVRIETQKAAKSVGKPKGSYITIEAEQMGDEDIRYHREMTKILSQQITEF